MLFRDGITPDYTADLEKTIDEKGPKKANRYVLSMWRCSRALGDAKLDMVELAWDTTLYALIGEELDPAECVVGAALENRARGGATLDMQLWFAVRDDKTCKAICSKLRELLNRRSKEVFEQAGGSRFGGSEAFVFPRFEKDVRLRARPCTCTHNAPEKNLPRINTQNTQNERPPRHTTGTQRQSPPVTAALASRGPTPVRPGRWGRTTTRSQGPSRAARWGAFPTATHWRCPRISSTPRACW
jgi:hypothetical protein